jgi:16S rRNA (guanine527-N7)-methyltransferase
VKPHRARVSRISQPTCRIVGVTLDSDTHAALERTIEWLGVPWHDAMTTRLERYATWLTSEGFEVGGIGPHERRRVWRRHLLDSLLLGKGFTGETLLDMGTGVGLPGLPLAIAFPHSSVVLVARAGRRADAVRRAAAVLDIAVEVLQADLHTVHRAVDRVVTRATLPPSGAVRAAIRLLNEEGEAWIALGHQVRNDRRADWRSIAAPEGWKAGLIEVPAEILDSPVWMLRIART